MAVESFRIDPKVVIVLQAMSGEPISKLCAKYGISETEFKQWRAEVMVHLGLAFMSMVLFVTS